MCLYVYGKDIKRKKKSTGRNITLVDKKLKVTTYSIKISTCLGKFSTLTRIFTTFE